MNAFHVYLTPESSENDVIFEKSNRMQGIRKPNEGNTKAMYMKHEGNLVENMKATCGNHEGLLIIMDLHRLSSC